MISRNKWTLKNNRKVRSIAPRSSRLIFASLESVARRDHSDLEGQMSELRNEIDESAVFTEHFLLKRNQALKELALLKDKVRAEEEQSYATRRQALENEYQQTVIQLKELTRRCQDLETSRQTSLTEMNQLTDLYKKLEEELHDLILNNIRLECNLRTIEEQTLLTKAVYETEKADLGQWEFDLLDIHRHIFSLLASEQVKQQQFYTNELDKAIADIKSDFQTLLKSNKVMLENAYTERIEQVKTQISTYQQSREQEASLAPRVSVDSLHTELKQTEKLRDDVDKEYRPLLELFMGKQKEKTGIDEERTRLDLEYNRLISEINQISEAIEVGKRYWFSVHFELETYRRLLDLQISNPIVNNHHVLANGKEEHKIVEEQQPTPQIIVKKLDSQRAITKTGKTRAAKNFLSNGHCPEGSLLICHRILGKFDLDQVQAGFVSINNASENCVDQSLKGWTLVRTINDGEEVAYQFPDSYVLKAKTRVRVYSNRVENSSGSSVANTRLIATSIPTWTSAGQTDNVKILLLDDKGNTRATYTEMWQ